VVRVWSGVEVMIKNREEYLIEKEREQLAERERG
jgi:hypothetical protein